MLAPGQIKRRPVLGVGVHLLQGVIDLLPSDALALQLLAQGRPRQVPPLLPR